MARRKKKTRRTAAQRRAFRRMIAGLKKSRGRVKRRRSGARRATVVVKTNPRKRRKSMARRRRTARRHVTTAILVNPSRKRRVRRRRLGSGLHRRRRGVHRRRRNPGGMLSGLVGSTIRVGVPALIGGAAIGFVDARFLSKYTPAVRIGAKVAGAAALGVVLRKKPELAKAAMAGMLGTLGYEQGVTFGGGMVAKSGAEAAKGAGALIRDDPQAMGALVSSLQSMGLSLEPMGGGDGAGTGTALPDYAFSPLG